MTVFALESSWIIIIIALPCLLQLCVLKYWWWLYWHNARGWWTQDSSWSGSLETWHSSSTWGLVARRQHRGEEEPLSLSNFPHPTLPQTLYFFPLTHLFFPPIPSAFPVVQNCNTSLASIISGSNKPTGRKKWQCVNIIFPPMWGQLCQEKPPVFSLYLTIPKQAER